MMLRYTKKAHTFGKKNGINKYLVDLTKCVNPDSLSNIYNFAYKDVPGTDAIDKSAIVVMLVAPDDHSHDFAETVSRNSGYNVTLFREREQAVKHLKSS